MFHALIDNAWIFNYKFISAYDHVYEENKNF